MIDVNAIIEKALAAERQRVEAVRAEKAALLEKLIAQRDELVASIAGLQLELVDVNADLQAIDALATTP
jgi:hypothetical protein